MKVEFADFKLDTDARRLSRRGGDVHLSSKAFDLLRLLVERRPNVLDKASLHERLWPRTFVVEANLTVLAAELRRALGDSAREPQFIRTVHGHGYAFCAAATDVEPPEAGAGPARCWLTWNGRAIVLPEGASVIGRDPECLVWVDASGVSRRHARIEVERGGSIVRIEDLGSKNGTVADGATVDGVVQINDGSVVQVGNATLVVRVWSRGTAAETERISRRGDEND